MHLLIIDAHLGLWLFGILPFADRSLLRRDTPGKIAKNLTSNTGLFLWLEHANKNGILDLIDHGLVFDNPSTNKIKMNHLFLLFKKDFANGTEYRQQIKMFRLKYIFLAGKIIRTARSVVMKLSEKYPYREMYEQSFP